MSPFDLAAALFFLVAAAACIAGYRWAITPHPASRWSSTSFEEADAIAVSLGPEWSAMDVLDGLHNQH